MDAICVWQPELAAAIVGYNPERPSVEPSVDGSAWWFKFFAMRCSKIGRAAAVGNTIVFLPRLLGAKRLFLLAAGLLTALRLSAQCDPSPSDLISWWPGDGNANDIASTNNGFLEGGATADTPGVVDTAFQFDGTNGYVAIPDAESLHPANLTVETWIRSDLLSATANGGYPGQQYIIFHQNTRSGNFEGFDLAKDREPPFIGTTDTWCFEVTSATNGVNIFVESTTPVHTNEWYHVAGVRGSNYIQIYVNGVLEDQTSVDFPVSYGNHPLYFADTGESYYDPKFAGALDEVGLYNRALSSNEIYAIYAAGRNGKCKMPTALALDLATNTSPPVQTYPQVTIGGLPGQTYGIQAAASLPASSNDWVGLTNLTLSTSADTWLDSEPAVEGQKYYRVVPGSVPVP
jgi:Concanavalin A-like lectin/glucanases superfamily